MFLHGLYIFFQLFTLLLLLIYLLYHYYFRWVSAYKYFSKQEKHKQMKFTDIFTHLLLYNDEMCPLCLIDV